MILVNFIFELIKTGSLFAIAYILYWIWIEYKNSKIEEPYVKKQKPDKAEVKWQTAEKKYRAKVYEE